MLQRSLSKASRISIIGLGNIGNAVKNNLLSQGFNVNKIYDKHIDYNKSERDINESNLFQNTIQDVIKDCDVLITCLGTPSDIKQCVEEENMFDYMAERSIWIDHTTTDYEQTLSFAAKAKSKYNIDTLECPLTGGITLLKKGQMTMYVGGEQDVYHECLPMLQCSSSNILYLGSMGNATVIKVLSNMLASVNTVAMGEALMIAKRSNIDLETAWNAIRYSAGNSFVWETEAPLVFNGTYDPNFSLEFQCKDMTLGQSIANKLGTSIELNSVAHRIYDDARLKYGDKAPSSLPPKLLEDELNEPLQIPNTFDHWTYSIDIDEKGSVSVIHDFDRN